MLSAGHGHQNAIVAARASGDTFWLAASRALWPGGLWLLWFVVLGSTALDYFSTHYALALSGQPLMEGNPLARWSLERGGFGGLALFNGLKLAAYAFLAMAIAVGYRWLQRPGWARFSSVLLLVYYSVVGLAATVNNLVLSVA